MTRTGVRAGAVATGLALANLALAVPAEAHTGPFGITGYPALVLHPFILLDHFFCLLAAGLLAGQQHTGPWRALAALVIGATAGFAALVLTPGFPGEQFLPLVLAGLIGLLVAVAPKLGPRAAMAVVAAAGFAVGFNTYPEDGLLFILAATLAGLLAGASIIVGVPAFLLARADKPWQHIAIRIAGSWIAASAVLVLALVFTL